MASKALAFVRSAEGKIFLNNKFIEPTTRATSSVYNPKDNSVITNRHPLCGRDDVHRVVESSRKALRGPWGSFTGVQRAKCLHRWADLLEKNSEEVSYCESISSGRLMGRLVPEMPWVANVIRYYAGWCDKLEGDYIPDDNGFVKIVRHEPLGVCAGIIPWNGPLIVLAMKAAPALATGNTFILKPPEKSPLSSLYAASLLEEAGFPEGVFNVVTGDGSAGEMLSSHMNIDKVSFTGSVNVGRKIAAAANASNMKRVTLELGGKSPALVFPDADIQSAVQWLSKGITMNAGQVCVAPSRVLVHESIADKFISGIQKEFEKIASSMGGDPQERSTSYGPVVDSVQLDRVHSFIEQGKQAATLVTGGYRDEKNGNYVPPTLFLEPDTRSTIYRDEIFGPVLCVRSFSDEQEAVELANDTEYGLAAYVFTEDTKRIFRVTKNLQAGSVGVNAVNMLHAQAPFGGYKSSGMGRELGKYPLHDYTAIKTIYIKTTDLF